MNLMLYYTKLTCGNCFINFTSLSCHPVEAPPPYAVSLNMPKPNQSSTTLDTSQQQIESGASTGDDASSPPPTYNDVVRNHHPVSS